VVRSNKVARKRLTESNGTPAMDLGHMNVVLKWCTCMLVYLGIVDINIITILMFSVIGFGCGLKNWNGYYYQGSVVHFLLGFEDPT